MSQDIFFRFYANLPLIERRQVILDLKEKGGPITWEVAYNELKANTDLGQYILQKLFELGLLPKPKSAE